ncbi:MAG: TetR family transcriptional regulator [Clostridiales bacterium]|nr:TetR family transcriptional regulator [Clostridiales bacterium]
MKHEITTLNTKKTLAASLKKLMMHKPLGKISISELITDCGVNRKTFYYHFQDIYDLLKWILEQEAIEVVKGFDLLVNPEEALLFAIGYVDENKHIINCAYDAMGREEMKRFFFTDFYGVVQSIVQNILQEQKLCVSDHFVSFIITFYTEALAGMLINYFQEKEQFDRQELVDDLIFMLKNSIPNMLENRAEFERMN